MIHVLTPIHNRKDMTASFLEALRKQTYRDFDVTVVDDGSTDGTAEMLASRFPEAQVLRGNGNLWWTGAMRMGAEAILSRAAADDFILCANNDQIPDPSAIEMLLQSSIRHERAIVAAVCKASSVSGSISDTAYTVNWLTHKYSAVPVQTRGDYTGAIDVISCRFTLVPAEVFKQAQFDAKRFPHYLGDYDFFIQAKRAGYRLALSYDSVVRDTGGASGTERTDADLTLKQAWNNIVDIRSHANVKHLAQYILKNCPNPLYKPILLGRLGLKHGYLIARALAKGRLG